MAKASHRTPVQGPAFIRLLASLTDADVPREAPSLADRLGRWVDWNRAVALSRALDGALPDEASDDALAATPGADKDPVSECARLHAAQVDAIAAWAPLPADKQDDFDVLRQRYIDRQRSMQTASGYLRGHLRDHLARRSPAMARLAEVDAVMEQTLSAREQGLLAAVPDLLGRHFARLQAAAQPVDKAPGEATSDTPVDAGWRDSFLRDMRAVALAELEVRFHPIEGLLAALRT